jgi:hypothetical protein
MAIGNCVGDQKRPPERDPATFDGRREAKPYVAQDETAPESSLHSKCFEP